MAITQIGINFTELNNITAPNISISSNAVELLNQIPQRANDLTNGYLGYGIVIILFITFMWLLSDKTPFANFGYDNGRALSISLGISSFMIVTQMQINFITSFRAVAFNLVLYMLSLVLILFYENKE